MGKGKVSEEIVRTPFLACGRHDVVTGVCLTARYRCYASHDLHVPNESLHVKRDEKKK